MNENIKSLLEKVEADPELKVKFSEAKDPDEAYAIASTIQGGFTKEEFITEMTRIKEAMDENLTEDDLVKSAGGMDDGAKISLVTVSIGVTTTVSVCAASSAV